MSPNQPLSRAAQISLGIALFWALIGHLRDLPLLPMLGAAGLLALHFFNHWRQASTLPRWLLWMMGAAMIGLTLFNSLGADRLVGRDIAVALLLEFSALKLLENRTIRDGVVSIQLAFFLLLTHFLEDQPFWLALYVFATATWLLRTWLLLYHPAARVIQPVRSVSKLILYGLPWVVVLFFLFPRLDHPLWQMPNLQQSSVTGISDTMSPGSMGDLTQSTEIAFRVDFDGAAPPAADLYWRALVFWHYDGETWSPLPARREITHTALSGTPKVGYTITLEAHQQRWLYALDRPENIATRDPGKFGLDGEYLRQQNLETRMRYHAVSGPAQAEALDESTRALALQLPDGNPKTRALGAKWAQLADPAQRVNTALAYFHDGPFRYTLRPPRLSGNRVDNFLFGSHAGFCEHYSSAFVMLMRAAGVPARIVVGYQGAEKNEVGNYYIVRQADAHAWAEVWLAQRGWVRVDPTAAIAPERVENGIAAALGLDENLPVRFTRTPGWIRSLRWGMDNMVNSWNSWVLSYDQTRQQALLNKLGLEDAALQGIWLVILLTVSGGLIVGIPQWLHWLRRPRDPVAAQYAKFCRKLARAGCARAPNEGPADFAQRASAAFPNHAQAIQCITEHYIALRYTQAAPGSASVSRLADLSAHVRAFRRPR